LWPLLSSSGRYIESALDRPGLPLLEMARDGRNLPR